MQIPSWLVDNLSDDQRRVLTGWTEAGGTLVVVDPSSPLSPGSAGLSGRERGPARAKDLPRVDPFDAVLERGCPVPALQRVNTVVSPPAVLLPVPPGATGCFSGPSSSDWVPGPGGEAWLVVPRGRGSVVALGGAAAFTNSDLDRADNALLAVDLLAPRRGAEVVVAWVSPTGSGREGLVDLVPTGVKLALCQLGLAFVVVALGRARRLGRPVTEYQRYSWRGRSGWRPSAASCAASKGPCSDNRAC